MVTTLWEINYLLFKNYIFQVGKSGHWDLKCFLIFPLLKVLESIDHVSPSIIYLIFIYLFNDDFYSPWDVPGTVLRTFKYEFL